MINEENNFNEKLNDEKNIESVNTGQIEENLQSTEIEEKPLTNQNQELPNSNFTNPVLEKKKNPYKIAFFTLGGIIILGSASIFGYKYYKDRQSVPAVEVNTCLDTDTKIYDAYKDAVVMVRHQYGYFARIKGREIRLDVPDAPTETLYGTAFFVDRKGNMISNSHVLEPWNSDEYAEKLLTNTANFKKKIASILTTDIAPEGYETFIMRNWENATAEYSEEEGDGESDSGDEFVSSNDAVTDTAAASVDIAAAIPNKEYVSEEDIHVYVKTIDISVTLHNSSEEWLSCNVVKISEDQAIDLGVLQLSDKETPSTVTNIIDLNNSISDDKSLHPGEKAVMIGYPLGEDLAQTNSGIKVQLYNGQISKESDGTKIQYSVTSTHGASGAPVFNNCGQLIAVNFSGIDQVQGFNFGIVAKQIKSVYQ